MNAKYSYKENLKITHGFVEGKLLQKNSLSLSFNNFLGNLFIPVPDKSPFYNRG